MFVEYKITGNKYYFQGKPISKKEIEKKLDYQQMARLIKTKLCRVRVKEEKIKKEPLKKPKINKDEKLLKDNIHLYRLELGRCRGVKKYEIWKKNKYGYFNFISYIDNKEDFNNTVLKDLKSNKE